MKPNREELHWKSTPSFQLDELYFLRLATVSICRSQLRSATACSALVGVVNRFSQSPMERRHGVQKELKSAGAILIQLKTVTSNAS